MDTDISGSKNGSDEWWDTIEFDFFSSLKSNDKVAYMYDLYCDEFDSDEFDSDEFDSDDDMLSDLNKRDLAGVTQHTDALVIIASSDEVIQTIANRIIMNGLILKLHSKEEINSKFKSVYSVIGITNVISVN